MKTFQFLLSYIFLFSSHSFADSPLTSTQFYKAYGSLPIIQDASKSKGILTEKLMRYLSDPSHPIDIKVALINRLGWDINGKHNANLFIKFLQKTKGYQSIKDLKERASSHEILCIGYLLAMDNYKDVKEALIFSNIAATKETKSYTIQMINALILSQTFSYGNWCKKYEVLQKVKTATNLTIVFKSEASDIIFQYISSYKTYCK
jgi:hypothetical protein